MTKKRAILYIRVSTDEQAEKGHSLKHQEERLRNYCAVNGLEVVGFYREDHSAKTFDRPEFGRLLDFLKRNKEAADILLFLKWDRFSRNAPEAYAMIGTLRKYKVEPQAIEQPLDLSVPENKIMLAVYLTTPEVENDRRALNILAGMRRAMKDGRWLGKAPVGFSNKRDENNKPCIVPSDDADLVKHAFEEFATGQYHIDILRKKVNGLGLKVSRNAFWWMLRNPVYIGKVLVPAFKDEPAMVVEGRHESIISSGLFYEVQEVLLGRKKTNFPAHHSKHEELVLRGFLQCNKCGKTLTGSASKGNGGKYFYYHCTNGCNERFRAQMANDIFIQMLSEISKDKRLIKSVQKSCVVDQKAFIKANEAELQHIEKELERYRKRLQTAEDMALDREMDMNEFRAIKTKIEPEIQKLINRQMKFTSVNPEEQDVFDFCIEYLNNMPEYFRILALDEKTQMLGSMFPEKLVYENKELRTIGKGSFMPLLLNTSTSFRGNREAGSRNFEPASQKVVPSGFEPEQTEPKSVVLPLHHGTILPCTGVQM